MNKDTKKALRNTLANLYPTVVDSLPIIANAGLNRGQITTSDKPINNWFAILTDAENRGKLKEVVEAALEDYPDHPLLKQVLRDGDIEQTAAPSIGDQLPWKSEAPISDLEKLMGKESTLMPISFLEVGLQRSRSVARVKRADGAMGSGFLTSNNIFITNNHVLENAAQAKEAIVQFNYQNTFAGLDLEPTNFNLDPDNGFATSVDDDWTLVKVKGDANTDWGEIVLKPVDDYKKLEYVNIIQHPRGGPKQIALYHNIVAYADEKRLQYLTDTLEGSSGSPVFDNRWRVVALHHSGGDIIEPETKKPVFRNEGININIVVEALAKF